MESSQHKTALVTGSSSRLGKLIAAELVNRGFKVIVHGREASLAERSMKEIGAHHWVAGQLHMSSTMDAIVNLVDIKFERKLGLLVHNASTFARDIKDDLSSAHVGFRTAMESASWVYVLNARLAAQLRRSGGVSLALTDYATAQGWPGFVAHGSAKTAIEGIQGHLSELERPYARGKASIRYASLRLPTVLPPDGCTDLDGLVERYGPIANTETAVGAIVDAATTARYMHGKHAMHVLENGMIGTQGPIRENL